MRQSIDPPLWIEVHHLPENDEVDEQVHGQPTISPCCSDTELISDDEEDDEHELGFRSRLLPPSPFIKEKLTQKTIDENILLSKRKALEERRTSGLTQRTYSSSSGSRYSTDTTRTPSERAERLGKMNRRLSELSKLSNLALKVCDDQEDESLKGHDDDKSPNNQESSCAYYDLDGVRLLQKKIIDSRIKNRENRIRDMNERLTRLKLKLGGLQGSEDYKHL
jgi:hypothetical protein